VDQDRPSVALAVCGNATDSFSLISQVCAAGGLAVERTDFGEAKLHVRHGRPVLIVTELRLGPYNGLHLAALARPRQGIPVIVLADAADQSLRGEAERLGAIFAIMPLTARELRTVVDRALNTERRPVAAASPQPSMERRQGERRQDAIAWAADRERRSGQDRRWTHLRR
jgi:DNA-binding NtrC family response regulator